MNDKERLKKIVIGKQRVDLYSELLNYSVRQKMTSLATISALSAASLVVATFNPDLLPLTSLVKILISVLLVLVPLSMWGFLLESARATKHAQEKIQEITKDVTGHDIMEQFKNIPKNRMDVILAILPFIMNSILSISILIIIILIW